MEQLSAMGQLRRKYLSKKGWSQTDLARAVNRSQTTISFLLSERRGSERYHGRRAPKAGEVSVDFLVDAALEIPAEEIARAVSEDAIRAALDGLQDARAQLAEPVTSTPHKRSGSTVGEPLAWVSPKAS